MSMTRFSCPECARVLQLGKPLTAGQQVRCPACQAVFSAPEDEARRDDAFQSPSPPRPRSRHAPDDDEDQRPRRARSSRRSRAEEDADDFVDDFDDPDDWADERASRRGRARRKHGSGRWLLVGGGVTAVLVIFVFLGFVWPGFFGSRGPAHADLLAFLPAKANLAVGIDLTKQNGPKDIENARAALQAVPGFPTEMLDLLRDGERLIAGVDINDMASTYSVAYRSKAPYDAEKIRKMFQAGPAKVIGGKNCFMLDKGLLQGQFLALVDDRTIVIGSRNQEDRLGAALANRQPALPAMILEQIQEIDRHDFWLVLANDGKIKQAFQQARPLIGFAPGVNDLMAKLERAKGFSIWGQKIGEKGFRFHAGMTCGDSADARELHGKISDLWNQGGRIGLDMARGMFAGQPGAAGMGGLFDDVVRSFEVDRKGALVFVSVEFSSQTVAALEAQQKQMFAGWPGQNPFGIGQPPDFKAPPIVPPFKGVGNPPPKGRVIFTVNDSLTPAEAQQIGKSHDVKLTAGKQYSFDMVSTELDAFLRLQLRGQELAADDDGGGNLNARIIFRATESGVYQVQTSAWNRRPGRFTLTVRELDAP